jgi:ubiquitin-protein ligase
MLPEWVLRDKNKYIERLKKEKEMLEFFHNQFEMLQEEDGTLFIEGQILSLANNIYNIKIIYPVDYPHSPPICLAMDKDVIKFCENKSVSCSLHNYGIHKEGLKLCLMKPNDTIGTGWRKDFTVITMIPLVAMWLNLYEVAKVTGKWIGPEAD